MQTHQRNWISIQPSHKVSFIERTSYIAALSVFVAAALLSNGGAEVNAMTHSACTDQNRTQITAGGEALANGANRNRISPFFLDQESGLTISNFQYTYQQSDQQDCAPDTATDDTAQSTELVAHAQILSMRVARLDQIAQPDNRATGLARAVQVSKHVTSSKRSRPSKSSKSGKSNSSGSSSGNAAVGTRNLFPYGQCTWWADQRYHQLHGVYVPWVINANAWQWVARAK
ncbi:MAG TPA: CHAP domain-containing protein, partial [Ktedonobacteraceae bacterium]